MKFDIKNQDRFLEKLKLHDVGSVDVNVTFCWSFGRDISRKFGNHRGDFTPRVGTYNDGRTQMLVLIRILLGFE